VNDAVVISDLFRLLTAILCPYRPCSEGLWGREDVLFSAPQPCPPRGFLSYLQEPLLGCEEFEELGFLLFGIRQFLSQQVPLMLNSVYTFSETGTFHCLIRCLIVYS
jgi:hypothetical protein